MKLLLQLIAIFAFFVCINAEQCSEYEDECPITNTKIIGSSFPTCGKTKPQQESDTVFSIETCAYESPKAFGGKFDVAVSVYGTITRIDQIDNRDNYCTEPEGKGTGMFKSRCECKGGCKIAAYWKIYYDTSVQPPMTDEYLSLLE